jgi:hypothetical protein
MAGIDHRGRNVAKSALLDVWSLTPPWSGLNSAPHLGPAPLYKTTFYITNFDDTISNFPTVTASTLVDGSTLVVAEEKFDFNPKQPPPNGVDSCFALTVTEVVAFRFYAGGGWPGLVDLGGLTIPLSVGVSPSNAGKGPFASNLALSQGAKVANIFAYRRLTRTADWRASFVRLTQSGSSPTDGWWLMFRFPMRAPLLGDWNGCLSADDGGLIDGRLLGALSNPTLPLHQTRQWPLRVDLASNVAEARSGASSRVPYFAGVLSRSSKSLHSSDKPPARSNLLEAVAVNAAALSIQSPINDPASNNAPTDINRLYTAAALVDGIWWAKNEHHLPASNDSLDEPTLNMATIGPLLAGALASGEMPSCPDKTKLPSAPILSAITSQSPAWQLPPQPFVSDWLPLLELFGLSAAETLTPDPPTVVDDLAHPPFHYLHTRLVSGDVGGAASMFEHRRWVGLSLPEDVAQPGQGLVIPVLVRSRPGKVLADASTKVDLSSLSGSKGARADFTVRLEGLVDAHALAIWSKWVAAPARDAANMENGARALGLAPILVGAAPANNEPGQWILELDCSETLQTLQLGPSQAQPPLSKDFVRAGRLFKAASAPHRVSGKVDWFSVDPIPSSKAIVPTAAAALIKLPGFRTHGGEPLEAVIENVAIQPDGGNVLGFSMAEGAPSFLAHSVSIGRSSDGQSGDRPVLQTVAIGALDVLFDAQTAINQTTQLSLRFEGPGGVDYAVQSDPTAGGSNPPQGLVVYAVTVGASDDDGRPKETQSLVWMGAPSVSNPNAPQATNDSYLAGNLRLALRDTKNNDGALAGQRQTILSLRTGPDPSKSSATNLNVVVLDPQPMSVAQITLANAFTSGLATSDVVATWQTPDAVWRLVDDANFGARATLTLPAQGLAEAWERRYDSPGPSDYLPPDQLPPGARAPSRLSPATHLTIQSEAGARNPAAAWNLRRLFSDFGRDFPGAKLISIDSLETFYGLEAHDTPTPGLQLAELAGWRGVPRDAPKPITRPPTTRETIWQRAADVVAGRLAVLDARETTDLLARPAISNVAFRIRKSGHYAKTLNGLEGSDTDWWHDDGVQGGALAGFEDPGLVHSLLREAEFGTGTIDGLQLSAVGAWTRPSAAFNGGLTRISATVEAGRTSEARFERIGRIGILRTKAKHVIVYRRSFLPSRQFVTDQDPHLGRPIVRKVEEYIEIIQPLRTFPDTAGAGPRETGPTAGVRFRTIRIAVHGAWRYPLYDKVDGQEIGYAIPLWREGADLDVYPKPHAEVLTAGDAGFREAEPGAQRIDNIADLVFYTLLSKDGVDPPSDTDQWPNLYGVDYGDVASDSPLSGPPLTSDRFQTPGDPARKLEPAPQAAAGQEPFTLRLESGPLANLTRGRSGKAVMAQLQTLTLMRAKPPTKPGDTIPALSFPSDTASARAAVRDNLNGWLQRIGNGPLSAADKASLIGVIDGDLARLAGGFDKAKSIANGLAAKACGAVGAEADKATDAVNRVQVFLSNLLDAAGKAHRDWTHNREDLLAAIAGAQDAVSALQPPGAMAKQVIGEAVLATQRAATAQLANTQTGLKAKLDNLRQQASGVAGRLDTTCAAACTALRQALAVDPSKFDLTAARAASAVIRAIGDTMAADAQTAEAFAYELADIARRTAATIEPVCRRLGPPLDQAATELADAAGAMGTAARAAQGSVADLAKQIDTAISRVQAGVIATMTALNKTLQDLFGDLSKTANTYGMLALDVASKAIGTADAKIGDVVTDANKAIDEVTQTLTDAVNAIPSAGVDDSFTTATGAFCGLLSDLRKAAVDATTEPAALTALPTQIQSLKTLLTTASRDIDAAREAVCAVTTEAMAEVQQWLNGGPAAAALLRTFRDQIAAANSVDDALRGVIGDLRDAVDTAAAEAVSMVQPYLDALKLKSPQAYIEDGALRLLRACGAPPEVSGLLFNRDRLAYYFDETARIVTTPVTALMDQAGAELRGLGVTLPTLGIGDQLLAPVSNFFNAAQLADLSDVLSVDTVLKDLAGLKQFMSGLDMSGALGSAVRITHDVDVKTRTAWIQADVNYQPGNQDLFRISSFALRAEGPPVITAQSRYDRTLAGAETKLTTANVLTDLALELGGAPLVRVRKAQIKYDSRSGLSFDINPQNIEFDGALQAISAVLSTFMGSKSPVKIELLSEGGRPVGLKCSYDMPPTNFTCGGFTLLNASLGVHLDLALASEFEIHVFAYLGRRTSPFSMIVTWLGGGGYLEADARYRPGSGATDIAVAVSLGACAGAGFTFGVLTGEVQVYFGVEATFASHGGASRLIVAGVIVVNGSVTAWGFVTVYLCLTLALSYSGGNHAQGQGDVSVTVEVSRFFSLSFSDHLTYTV